MRMSMIFMNSENKTSDEHRLKLTLADKMDLQRGDNRVAISDLSIYYTLKIIQSCTRTINLKY